MENKIIKNMITYILLTSLLSSLAVILKIPLNIITSVIVNIIIIVIIYFINRKEINEMFITFKSSWKNNLKQNLLLWIIGFILMMASNYLITVILKNDISVNEQLVRELFKKYFFISIISNVICAPILEELVFRLSFNNIKNKYVYLISSSLIFALFHTIEQTKTFIDLVYLLPYLSLGFAFGLVYYKSKNIFDSILIHALHNAVILAIYFII